MPVLHGSMADRPSWCELEDFQIVTVPVTGRHTWSATRSANKLVVVEGSGKVTLTSAMEVAGSDAPERTRAGPESNAGPRTGRELAPGESVDVPAGTYHINADAPATVVTLSGHWGDDCGGAGIFGVQRAERPGDIGDPVTYPKHTAFDRHYHDCDEYWIMVRGRGTACSEGMLYEVGPGDCVATRMGHHHDFPLVEQPVLAVFFETTMRGRKRRGHLWEHTHGPAVPAEEGG